MRRNPENRLSDLKRRTEFEEIPRKASKFSHINPAYVIDLLERGMRLPQIAAIYNCSPQTVSYQVRKEIPDFDARKHIRWGRFDITVEDVVKMYEESHSSTKIARALGVNTHAVTQRLEKAGIRRRSQYREDITEEKIRQFRLHLARVNSPSGETIKKNTQAYYIIAIRNFLKYLMKRDINVVSPDKIELPKLPSRQISIIDESDLSRLLKTPKGNDIRALRDKAILELLFSTGLRLFELCSLNRYLNFDRGEITIRGKGDKLRVVFISSAAKKAIKEYLDKRDDSEEYLFISLTKKGKTIGQITPRAVQRMVDSYAKKAGIQDRITPHMIRHLFATDLLLNGADLRAVQELLGHSNISTTQVYTHLTNKNLREIHKAFHGRRR